MKFKCESYADNECMMGSLVASGDEDVWYWLRFDEKTGKCYSFTQVNDEVSPEIEMSWETGLVILQSTKSQIPEDLYDFA